MNLKNKTLIDDLIAVDDFLYIFFGFVFKNVEFLRRQLLIKGIIKETVD